ncbi:MAG TPA: PadR family transcriptional regulator [Candidatus Nanopelagicaceae bacterium]|nr:PadR family transcriptional regulator [Candidatus Nanopelagicaceae bacterium]
MAEETEIKIQNLTKFYILVLLKSNNTVTGYFILKKLEKDLGKTASPTYVYDFLKSLKSQGYVEDVTKSKTSKRSKGYQLTSQGHEFIDRIFLRFNNLIEVAIQSRLEICASCGVKLYDNYHSEKIGNKILNFCCKHCAKAFKNAQM